ncbi:metal ABC transporter solute-binding protein, Zn/Mn family [Microbacterium album]|uniref:Metal ABC transporter substrate-binding protein n=1 Tax=Microbacterium album TaxID=2053191 RepID=A0A917MNQ5_9MICO|nr:zinc ABC transporter substrate-binding protein [Microbacterium album]GGH42769.1 hypothetical protein GCM10010921_16180 [Microbacterium album]
MVSRRVLSASVLVVPAVILAGCAGAASEEEAAPVPVIVASTNVYASLAQALVGDAVEVTPIIDTATQDPHSYEATARDRLTVQEADLVIVNGGGYDPFMEALIGEGDDRPVVTAIEFSHDYPGEGGHDHGHAEDDHAEEAPAEETPAADEHAHAEDEHDHEHEHDHAEGEHEHAEGEHEHAEDDHEHAEDDHGHADDGHGHGEDGHEGHNHIDGFNEHVWYDAHTMIHLVEALAEEIERELPGAVDPDTLAANRDALIGELEGLEARLDEIAVAYEGRGVFLTEPIGGYLAASAGLVDVTPDGFAEAVEEGQDVAPATLLAAIRVIESGEVAVVLANAQTGGAETDRVIETAESAGVPVVELSEVLTGDETYVEWMSANIDALEAALQG